MIRDNIMHCVCPVLLIALSALLGSACKVEAQLVLPKSIVEILGDTVVEELKAKEEVKAVKIAKRTEIQAKRANAVFWNPAAQTPEQMNLITKVKYFSVGMGPNGIKQLIDSLTGEFVLKKTYSDPNNPDGLAVKFAPSDEQLGISSP